MPLPGTISLSQNIDHKHSSDVGPTSGLFLSESQLLSVSWSWLCFCLRVCLSSVSLCPCGGRSAKLSLYLSV